MLNDDTNLGFSKPKPHPSLNDGAEPECAVKKRKLSRACNVCRKRKVRCDFVQLPSGNLQKCLNCFSSQTECVFTEDQKLRKTSKRFIEGLEKKVERSERLLELLCPDPKLRQKLLDTELDDLLTDTSPATRALPPPPSTSPSPQADRIIDPIANFFFKASHKSPVDLAVVGMRVQMFRRYPPEHDEFQDVEDEQIEHDDFAEAEHITQLTYNKMKDEHGNGIMHNTFFLGKSSGRNLLRQVVSIKEEIYSKASLSSNDCDRVSGFESDAERGLNSQCDAEQEHPNNEALPSDIDLGERKERNQMIFLGSRRPEYWTLLPWEKATFRSPTIQKEMANFVLEFPEPVLLRSLVDYYFKYINLEMPLLHRPTFETELSTGLHKRDRAFGTTVLLVCAIGSRFSENPQVLMTEEEGPDNDGPVDENGMPNGSASNGSASIGSGHNQRRRQRKIPASYCKGWNYFVQAWAARNSRLVFIPATLYELQYHCLATQYLQGSSIASWLMAGIGIRLAQDVGAHRRRKLKQHLNLETELVLHDELWKRAMWVLITLDRFLSAGSGRPCALHDEDFDLELPIECDDEYWDDPDPKQRFKQPESKPSLLTAFTLTIRLNQILAICLRSIYSINKSKTLLGLSQERWESKVISEIDSGLNKWFATMPPHLSWDPEQPNEDFFIQSAALHSAYYHTQILLHRPFIPTPNRPRVVSFPSLEICANAARSLIHIGLAQLHRTGEVSISMPFYVTSGAVILLLNMWQSRKLGKLTEQRHKADVENIDSCLKILKVAEKRWFSSGKLWDLVHSLATANELFVPSPTDPSKVRNWWGGKHSSFDQDDEARTSATQYYSFSPFTLPLPGLSLTESQPRTQGSSNDTMGGRHWHTPPNLMEASTSPAGTTSGHDLMIPLPDSPAATKSIATNPYRAPPRPPGTLQQSLLSSTGLYEIRNPADNFQPFYGEAFAERHQLDHSNPRQGGPMSIFEDGMKGEVTLNPGGDFEISSPIVPPFLWQDGSVPQLDNWEAYLTGVNGLTDQYDFLFPHDPLTMHPSQANGLV